MSLVDIALNRHKFIRTLHITIREFREEERIKSFNNLFNEDFISLATKSEHCFRFPQNSNYHYPTEYKGKVSFTKHYYKNVGELGIEEEKCAFFIDGLPEIKHWIRNGVKTKDAFCFQLANGKFYPDFICKLNDGRDLVIEYKGTHLLGSPDTQQKLAVGQQWERRSNGKCLFIMATEKDYQQQIRSKIKSQLK